ncbi:YALI0D00649p [Yarrowia lipolytica CLIB122]|jgi:protein AFG1|uniref:YALI0D00649p n=2 Tax=Yarrowia lipolytica TaxID=4952 RepID=Q6CAR2_YARLI|nr:YALI0D00649p [Yarrowia lipolytica CLIB122]AOW03388.1 hypothetical protein YALI1_D00703g [Yarrowia lipolytica]KAB8282580.1 AFG1-like ATPase-domain-containing protein [Yarrowia lipolytica]KAE8173230.1 AFG1-like ATPase-domain-containing protein [Yarrowia lipolytica]KAJ8054952.1 AFG1-like ATPase-domain-containing protein [Yarrowia lipolytica]RMI96826.1 AFG1-like ATPase-domain-containing protein [Yarrowia lipolytica]|eukprot:XP_502250.1 YALI0D00649p [Yarrowia lipolytica CLIB122]
MLQQRIWNNIRVATSTYRSTVRAFSISHRALSNQQRNPLEEYDYRVKKGVLNDDPYQRKIIDSLMEIHKSIENYHPKPAEEPSWLGRLFGKKETTDGNPKGIYLYGDVGCGKTMLMDLFYDTIPNHLTKDRAHFHNFMQDVHHRYHELYEERGSDFDASPILAKEISKRGNVLCFDEFQVTDVADAMILRRIIELLDKDGVVLFLTSNRAPDELYKNGVQRESFIPCIELLKERTRVTFMESPTDYRKVKKPMENVYFFPETEPPFVKTLEDKDIAPAAKEHADKWFEYFSQDGPISHDAYVEIWGRKRHIPKSSNRTAQFKFHELCGEPLSAADYIGLCNNYDAFVITDIPCMTIQEKDLARRWITFLDAAYEAKSKLAVTAQRPFEHLFADNSDVTHDKSDKESFQKIADEMGIDPTVLASAGMFTGEEERFAYARALSRIHQMSTTDWVEQRVGK